MAKGSDMPVKYYNYKVEFQARGAGHIPGGLWIDMKDDKMMGNKNLEECDGISSNLTAATLATFPTAFATFGRCVSSWSAPLSETSLHRLCPEMDPPTPFARE